ncbi:MAG TPA: hypothetical protein ENI39_03405 [Anaerolineae bacterium]|nr:hypothetical protein [Anaerolineae bacterium]
MQSNDLLDFMRAITQEMEAEYHRIQKRVKEDPGTAGDQGEENWATLLREWLPPTYQVVTKGRILSHKGAAGPQVDVLVLHSTYPRRLLDKKHYLAGGVAAAFECKLTLRSEHIRDVFEKAARIRRLLLPRIGTPYKELNSPVVYGLLAHSHCWKGERSTPIENIENHIQTEDRRTIRHPREMVDFICVADLATWVSMKSVYPEPQTWYSLFGIQSQDSPPNSSPRHTPVGAMITYLLLKLAWENPAVRDLAYYFHLAKIAGPGFGISREWNGPVFTEETSDKIAAITAKGEQRKAMEKWFNWWDEWGDNFP